MKRILFSLALLLIAQQVHAADLETMKDVPYGDHERQVLDFYPAQSDKPTPVVFYIHGGGWQSGDKKTNPQPFLDNGISVVAINYRYVKNVVKEGVTPPVKAPLEDAARALQFVRSKADEWNLDKEKIGATGGSAGACSSLWLAFHDDMADHDSDDPIARESTRLACASVNGAQVTLDPKPLREWMPNYGYGAHAFGLYNLEAVIEKREELMPWIEKYSPMSHVTEDDPPIAMFYGGAVPVVGDSPKDPTHSAIMGVKLAEKLKETGVDVVLVHPGVKDKPYRNSTEYLIDHLTK
ncbi:alpha/beta hydrolase [Blastopirellula marina]|uniref:Lipase n=1 Tax=Blastopirellula marina TaxID=124 RepID=A0A2S8GBX8_9BACT|nr:alpha/beta hydrolase [Blastopirellula marina]PQO41965.1 lipase [Blastopirellula marina]